MKYIHTTSCGDPVQIGCGLPTYRGVPYQDGYGAYQGQVFQRGYGLGGIYGAVNRTSIKPVLKAVAKKVLPVLKNLGKEAVKRAVPAAKRIGKAATQRAIEQAVAATITARTEGKKMTKKKLKASAKDLAKSTLNDVIKEAQNALLSQSGSGYTRKRKRNPNSFTPSKKARRTIFD